MNIKLCKSRNAIVEKRSNPLFGLDIQMVLKKAFEMQRKDEEDFYHVKCLARSKEENIISF